MYLLTSVLIYITILVIKCSEGYPCPDTYTPSPRIVPRSKQPTQTQYPEQHRTSRQKAWPQGKGWGWGRHSHSHSHSHRGLGRSAGTFWGRTLCASSMREQALGVGHLPDSHRAKLRTLGPLGPARDSARHLTLKGPLKSEKEKLSLNP